MANLIDKQQPNAVEIEDHILGILVLYPAQISVANEFLKPESFYKPANQLLYKIIIDKFNTNRTVDILTISEEVDKSSLNMNRYELMQLVNNVTTYANLDTHCRIVSDMFVKRELIRIGNEIIKQSFDSNIDFLDVIDYTNFEILKISTQISTNFLQRIDSAINIKLKEISAVMNQKMALLGIPSNIKLIDDKTCGWQSPDLLILAARPSVGKTAFALKLAKESAASGFPCVFFSLEMSTGQLALRLISGESDYTQMELKTGRINDWQKLENGIKKFDNMPLYVDDSAGLSISQLKSRLINYIQKYDIKFVIIDYLQLMKGYGNEKNREAEVANISKSLKIFAKEYNIPIMALCQLNRDVETRIDKKPMMRDLRESGQIEQDADIIMFLRRDEMFNPENDLKFKMQIDFAKYRNGAVGEIELNYNVGMTDFFEQNINDLIPF